MKKHNQGMTIMEVLISVCIIAIVLILLFSLLLQVRAEDRDNNIQSTFILNQAAIIKLVEEDILDYGIKSVEECQIDRYIPSSEIARVSGSNNGYCVRFNYNNDTTDNQIGILMIYKAIVKWKNGENGYEQSDDDDALRWSIRYVTGMMVEEEDGDQKSLKFKQKNSEMKELPAEINNDLKPSVSYSAYVANSNRGTNAVLVSVPIETDEGEHYDIDVSFNYLYEEKGSTAEPSFKCTYSFNSDFCNYVGPGTVPANMKVDASTIS